MSAMDKFYASWKESLVIGGVAAIAVAVGVEQYVAQGANAVGLLGQLGPKYGPPVIVGGVVFLSDMVYNLFLQESLKGYTA